MPASAWSLVVASFAIHFCSMGFMYGFSVFYIEFMEEFGAGRSRTAVVASAWLSLVWLFQPVAGYGIRRFGCRAVSFAGGLCICVGLLCASVSLDIDALTVSYAAVGIGTAAMWLPAVTVVADSFPSKLRGRALGIAVCGSGVGTAVSGPLAHAAIDSQGWRVALRWQALITFVVCVTATALIPAASCGCTAGQFSVASKKHQLGDDDDEPPLQPNEQAGEKPPRGSFVFSNARFLAVFFVVHVFWALGFAVPFVFLGKYALEYASAQNPDVAAMSVLLGVGSVVGRLSAGFVSDYVLGPVKTVVASMACSGLTCMMVPVTCFTPASVWAASFFFGVFTGGVFTSNPLSLATLFDAAVAAKSATNQQQHVSLTEGDSKPAGPSALPLVMGCLGPAIFTGNAIGPPLAGYLWTVADSAVPGFAFAGASMMVSALVYAVAGSAMQSASSGAAAASSSTGNSQTTSI